MLSMEVKSADLVRGLNAVERKQLPIATVWALNDTAKDVLEHTKLKMDVVFDRPTRFTKNAMMVWRATKSTQMAEVKARPSVADKHFLKVQERGGARGQTGLERMLSSQLRGQSNITAVVPASGAKLNSFGNWSPAERRKVLASVTGGGSSAAPTGRRKSRVGYFVANKGSKLSPGIWKRSGKKTVKKVLSFTTSMPRYDRRLGFYQGATFVFEAQFPINFSRAFQRAMDTAR